MNEAMFVVPIVFVTICLLAVAITLMFPEGG